MIIVTLEEKMDLTWPLSLIAACYALERLTELFFFFLLPEVVGFTVNRLEKRFLNDPTVVKLTNSVYSSFIIYTYQSEILKV